MTDYTPTTAEIRGAYVQVNRGRGWDEIHPFLVQFDRWLDQVRAEAWDEGAEATALRIPEGVWHEVAAPRTPNPYRKEQSDD